MDGEDKGDFTQEGFPNFRWYTNVERIELPADSSQKMQQASSKQMLNTNNPMEMLSGFMGGFMSTLMEPIRLGLQESVRKITVRVKWNEAGKPEQIMDVVLFLTDPSRLETAVTLSANPSGNAGASGSSSGSAGSSGSKTPASGNISATGKR
jgi:hypothetical protein